MREIASSVSVGWRTNRVNYSGSTHKDSPPLPAVAAAAKRGVSEDDPEIAPAAKRAKKDSPVAEVAAVAAPQNAQGPPPWECGKCDFAANCNSYLTCYSCGAPRECKNKGLSAVKKGARMASGDGPRHPDGKKYGG